MDLETNYRLLYQAVERWSRHALRQEELTSVEQSLLDTYLQLQKHYTRIPKSPRIPTPPPLPVVSDYPTTPYSPEQHNALLTREREESGLVDTRGWIDQLGGASSSYEAPTIDAIVTDPSSESPPTG